jgi:hypothetical protein
MEKNDTSFTFALNKADLVPAFLGGSGSISDCRVDLHHGQDHTPVIFRKNQVLPTTFVVVREGILETSDVQFHYRMSR